MKLLKSKRAQWEPFIWSWLAPIGGIAIGGIAVGWIALGGAALLGLGSLLFHSPSAVVPSTGISSIPPVAIIAIVALLFIWLIRR